MKFILWPFKIIFELISAILNLTGRFVGVVLALVLMIVGLVATMTIIGGIIGIPLIVFGFLLLVKSMF